MMRVRQFLMGGVTVFSIWSFSGQSVAAVVQLPATGQKTCFTATGDPRDCNGTGEDGEKKMGVSWPAPRFSQHADQTVIDNLTGLVWAPDAGTPTVGSCSGGLKKLDTVYEIVGTDFKDYRPALEYVTCLNTISYLGHSDWRLPNRHELDSLIDLSASAPALPQNHPFQQVQQAVYWTSTANSSSFGGSFWGGDLATGTFDYFSNTESHYVWPVRGGQQEGWGPSAIPKTGQTTSIAAGDDGDLKSGVAWPLLRFSDHGDGMVTDNLTGLGWSKEAGTPQTTNCTHYISGQKDWQGALDYVACLNNDNYLGYRDWRLPNRHELKSLIDLSASAPALPAGHPFNNLQSYSYYWSATTAAAAPEQAWTMYMNNGALKSQSKTSLGYIWPVRAGGSGELDHLLLTVELQGNGNVTSSPSGIACNVGTCSARFAQFSRVALVPTAEAGYRFSSWSDDCSGGGACEVHMETEKKVTAVFEVAENARVNGVPYGTLRAAYASVPANGVVLARAMTFTEDLLLDRPVAFRLAGGFVDGDFSQPGGYTVLNGNLTIRNGSMTAERLLVR